MATLTTPLSGRTALATGSTGGLGVGIANALAHAGAFVVVTGRDKARGDAVVADIRSAGGAAVFASADLSGDDEEVHRLGSCATELAGGRLDILVNNAAMLLMPTPTADIPVEVLRDAFSVNVYAPFLLTGVIAPQMARHGGGAVVNIGSITGLRGGSGQHPRHHPQRGRRLVCGLAARFDSDRVP
jgi:NAD(P)-dependent dehydrogenase (short-subunit alcohol dehydrogenase family)